MQPRNSTNLWGIDVSHWQGEIDWQKVAAAGVQYAYVKATDGPGVIDPQFRRNAGGAQAVNIPVGFYHFAHVENNVTDEIENFCNAVKGLPVDLPHVLDLETNDKNLSSSQVTLWALTWLREVKKRTGNNVMIYSSPSFINDNFGPELGVFPLWVAHYGVDTPASNYIWKTWSVFQYSESGTCPGILGQAVDMNVMEADFFSNLKPKDDFTGHWAEGAIRSVLSKGLMNGYPDGTFKPDQPVTRAELAAVLIRLKQ